MLLYCLFLFCLVCETALAQPWFPQPPRLFDWLSVNSIHGDHVHSIGDVNRDGIPDVLINVVSWPWWYYHTRVLFGTRPGILDGYHYLELDGYGTIASGDINGDGLPDLVAQV